MLRPEYSSQHPPATSSSTLSSSSVSSPSSTASSSSSLSLSSASSPVPSSTVSASSIASPAVLSAIPLRRQRRRTASLRHHPSASLAPRPCTAGRPYQDHLHHHHNHQPRQHHQRHHPKSNGSITKNVFNTANPALTHKLRQMALPLSPLVQLTTGAVHPHFPTNVLQFWLLTDAQLESLAVFYHQTAPVRGGRPSPWAAQYPCPVRWRSDAPLEEKRRRMGRFIGLRGCGESLPSPYPSSSSSPSPVHLDMHVDVDDMHVHHDVAMIKTEDEIARDARMARLAAAVDQDALRRKTMAPGPGPWGR